MASESTFVLVVTYQADLDEIDTWLEAHRSYLDEHYASGEFVSSGPQVPRIGGVILARCADRARVEKIVAEDPFTQQGLATYEVIEFAPNRGMFSSAN